MPDSDKPSADDGIDSAISATSRPRNILRMELEGGRLAEVAIPMDLTEIEALQILGALPAWIIAARQQYLAKTAGGRIHLIS